MMSLDTDDGLAQAFESCQQQIGYRFNDVKMLEAALTHASGADHRLASNERLEFLGDAILGEIVCEQLFHRFPQQLEGELTRLKSIIVSRENCARVSREMRLGDYLILGKGMTTTPGVPQSVLAAVFESMIAAVYLDGGREAVEGFVIRHMSDSVEAAIAGEVGGNYKSQLQQLAQRKHGVTPHYRVVEEKGPDHSKCFKIAAEVGKLRFAPAWGRSKKESEQRAARNALSQLADESASMSDDHLQADGLVDDDSEE
jgi:ribonuclease III